MPRKVMPAIRKFLRLILIMTHLNIMNNLWFVLYPFMSISTLRYSAARTFDDYFTSGVLRVDYFLCGDDKSTAVFFDEMFVEPHFSEQKKPPETTDDSENLRYNPYDSENGRLLYSHCFVPLFQKWQTTEEAKRLQRCNDRRHALSESRCAVRNRETRIRRRQVQNAVFNARETRRYKNAAGLFEGGGYTAKNIFSPANNCRMKSNESAEFCPVSRKQSERKIKYHCG